MTLLFGKGSINSNKIDPRRAQAKLLVETLKVCPVCEGSLEGHRYALFSSAILNSQGNSSTVDFFQALKGYDWEKAVSQKGWNAQTDNVEAYTIECSKGRFALIVLRKPVEILEGDSLIVCEVIPEEAGFKLRSTIPPSAWRPLILAN